MFAELAVHARLRTFSGCPFWKASAELIDPRHAVALALGATLDDIANAVYAFPTSGEAVRYAAESALETEARLASGRSTGCGSEAVAVARKDQQRGRDLALARDRAGGVIHRVGQSPSMRRRPFGVVGIALLTMLVGVNLATPLYAVYRERFGFSIALLPLIFAVYALILVPSLLVFGQLSDRLGRRRVIAAGLGLAVVALLLFAFAQGTGWLFAARAVQGIAVGVMSGAASAALVELEPRRDRHRAALYATLAQAGGSAAGPVIAGMLAEWAPWPRTLCFLTGAGVTAVAALAVLTIPDARGADGGLWQMQRPRIPREIRPEFARASLTAAMVWAVAALFLSVAPTYTGGLLGNDNLALLGGVTALMLGASCVAQVISRQRSVAPGGAQTGGLVLLAMGLAALVLAFPLHSLALVLAGAVSAGVGHGLGFLGAQADVNRIAPADARGEVTAAFYACIYLGVAVPVIGVGLLALPLSLFAAVTVFAAVTGGIALATAAWHLPDARRA